MNFFGLFASISFGWEYAELYVTEGDGAAGMDPAELFVCHSAAVCIFRDIYVTAYKTGVTPSAFAAAAVRRCFYTGAFHCPEQ